MKVRLGFLKHLVREEREVQNVCFFLLSEDTNLDRAEKVADLVRTTIRDRSSMNAKSLFAYLKQLKVPQDMRQQLLDLLKKGNNVETVAATRDMACDVLGVRPSMTGSGDSDPCKPRLGVGKRAQLMDKGRSVVNKARNKLKI